MRTIIYVRTKNDRNGNPRRGWIIPAENGRKMFVDEGYRGRDALYKHFGMPWSDASLQGARYDFNTTVCEIPLDITVAQYNKLKRAGE